MKHVFMVKTDWSTTDDHNVDIELFKNYDDAYSYYKMLISDEMNPELSWVGSQAFDDEGNIRDGYELSYDDNNSNESDVYWYVSDDYDCYRYTHIDLIRMEVK